METTEAPEISALFENILSESVSRRATLRIHEIFDHWMHASKFSWIDLALTDAPLSRMSESLIVALLAASLPGKRHLQSRDAFVVRAEKHFRKSLRLRLKSAASKSFTAPSLSRCSNSSICS